MDQAVTQLHAKGLTVVPVQLRNTSETAALPVQQLVVAGNSNQFWIVQGLVGKVTYISRLNRFERGKEPNTEATIADLKAKFGHNVTVLNESNAGIRNLNHNFDIDWRWNAQGQLTPQRGSGAVFTCLDGGFQVPAGLPGAPGAQYLSFGMASFRAWLPHNTCASAARALLATVTDESLIVEMTLTVVDQKAIDDYDRKLYAFLKAKHDAIHQQSRENKAPL